MKKIKFYIKTFGCQMNVKDSEVICGLLKTMDYELAVNPEEADILIFNTCSVRKHAEDKAWSELGRFTSKRSVYKTNNLPVIGVVGCMAQSYKEEIFKRAPQVDFVVGPNDINKIPQIIKEIIDSKFQIPNSKLFEKKILETEGEIRPEIIYHTGFYQNKDNAYVIISEGCSNSCSYCIVPYVRGPLRNRDYRDILREIEETIDYGITKITLLGQNVNTYQYEDVDFVRLIKLVNRIKGLREFSFVTSHPKDTTEKLFRVMADCERLKKYLHLPVQSGSNRILKMMKRGYTREFYLSLIDRYRRIVKDGTLTTDLMVGFPTEKEEDFQDTVNLVKEIEFDSAYIFKYSVRPHTEAANLRDDIPTEEKARRHNILLTLQKSISKNKLYKQTSKCLS